MIIIGIDTGKKTGFAVNKDGNIIFLKTFGIIAAMVQVLEYRSQFATDFVVCIEDARKRKWLPPNVGKERLKGAGSVSRDGAIWQEFCEYHDLPYILVPPAHLQGLTKMGEDDFKVLTNWDGGRCSEHARDAGVMTHKYHKLLSKNLIPMPAKPSEINQKAKSEKANVEKA